MKQKELADLLSAFKAGEISGADGEPMTSLDLFIDYACKKLGVDVSALSEILSM